MKQTWLRRAGRILKIAGPAGPPVVQPIQFGSVVNLGPKYRRRSRRADMVIEQ
jgi:hypothetical protein